MTEAKRIPLDEADAKTLTAYATLTLGIDVKPGTNAAQLRAKIRQASPTCQDVPALDEQVSPSLMQAQQPEPGEKSTVKQALAKVEPGRMPPMSADPKVVVNINKTDDKRRAKDVTLVVRGEVVRIQRGVDVPVAYRVYEALKNAKEMAAVDSERINPMTNEPEKVWQEVYSYPFMVVKLPPQDEIDAWLALTGACVNNSGPLAKAA